MEAGPPTRLLQPLVLVDTHCHLDHEPLASSVEAVLTRARAAGIVRCISIGTTLATSRANIELARKFPIVHAAVGIHPHDADTVTDAMLDELDALVREPGVVAIGEMGLDHYRQHATPANQERVFRCAIALAQRTQLPLLIHCRDAYEPLLTLLRHEAALPLRGLIHCASGPPEFIRGALDLGLHVSFAGNVTFTNAHALRALVPLVPDDRLLVETDAPWLAPQPVRGQPNEPAYVAHTAACVAQLRQVSVEEIGRMTTRNACRLFNLPPPDDLAWN